MSHGNGPATPAGSKAGAALKGRLRVPGDKSISHRSMIFGLLSIGETRVEGLLEGDDVLRTAEACKALGAHITREGPGRWRVRGVGIGGLRQP
jgi:3-phosphoshikimate 1-carboxyvinyltransferase